MLRDLHVRDLAVLADVAVAFRPGLNILTGETGAGKSLVVDSLALLAGARASSDLIRTGAERLTVCGVFEPRGDVWRSHLGEAGIDSEGDELVVRREIRRDGRNRVFVNDQPVTLRLLGRLAPALLRIHAQRDELALVVPEQQRRWLDRSGGAEAAELLAETAERYDTLAAVERRLAAVEGDERLRLERIDLLRFQTGEIDAAGLVAGEEEGLRDERRTLRHAEAIGEALATSLEHLLDADGSASERLSLGRRMLHDIVAWESRASAWEAELDELRIRVDELAASLRERLERVAVDPRRLDEVEERLAALERLMRKYGTTTAEILEFRQRIGDELDDLAAADERREELHAARHEALERYRAAAAKLSEARRRWARGLAKRIHAELADLAMAKARFSVELECRPSSQSALTVDSVPVEHSAEGYDQVAFMLRANPGEEPRPLARTASGGELSRVYLALQLAAGEAGGAADDIEPTLVFDEVDAGIGGAEADALGAKLKRLAGGGQILVVTHLPQVASFADAHFRVEKAERSGRTGIDVGELDTERRVNEVARMLAGKEITESSRTHAEELIAVAAKERS